MPQHLTARTLLRLAGPPPVAGYPWLRLIGAPDLPFPEELAAEEPGDARLRVLHGERARNRDDNLAEWGRALDFPEYYGHNYAALTDCLRDQIFQPTTDPGGTIRYIATPLIVIVTNPADLLADASPADLHYLLDSINNPLVQPRTPPPPDTTTLYVLLHTDHAHRPALMERLTTAARPAT
jgi:hypothetical protein